MCRLNAIMTSKLWNCFNGHCCNCSAGGPSNSKVWVQLAVVFHDDRAHWRVWDSRACQWVIQLNRYESPRRQRFTLAHEYKHIIDHGRSSGLYSGTATNTPAEQAERAADYFAGCLLVPKVLLKRAYYGGMQQVADLARHFDVSEAAITCRLSQTGIVAQSERFRPDRRAFPGTFRYRMKPELQLQGV